jgi:hypothetical protein
VIYFCCTPRRRTAILAHPTENGIDFLEISDDEQTLFVHFLKNLAPGVLSPNNMRIEGGERITNVKVTTVTPEADPKILDVAVNAPGDFSTYTLRLVKSSTDATAPGGFDPESSAVDFSFKVECPNDFDCKTLRACPPEPREEPEINYLAKDYASFRQLMLDRMAALMPQWSERNPADSGIALVELMAYVGDSLSYQQDAIATEAYLGTARRRVSVRRHARLVDYFMHDGCNARVWIQITVNSDNVVLKTGTQILTQVPEAPKRIPPNTSAYDLVLAKQPVIFETMEDATLWIDHNEMHFYTYGGLECCLSRGATRATLVGKLTNLQKGTVLIFEEVLGPDTGLSKDANPAHRHAVRLTNVTFTQDPIGGEFEESPNANAVNITEIEWASEDALPFPLCISAVTDKQHGHQYNANVSVARGNMVLADHGITLPRPEPLGVVPDSSLNRVGAMISDRCHPQDPDPIPARFNPKLAEAPLTFAAPYDMTTSARAVMQTAPQDALPALTLTSVFKAAPPNPWTPLRDLLNSEPSDTEFVVEVERDGTASLRFGDNTHGLRPAAGTSFNASYRVGNGTAGNVGADSLMHIVSDNGGIDTVRNPLAAVGGVEPEGIEEVRQRAPYAYRTQERAVTPDDYARVTERNAQVQRAAASFRWTGSWRTVFVTVDRLGGVPVDAPFEEKIVHYLDRYRMAVHDVDVDAPRFVSLEIEMLICVKPDYFRSDVKQALLELFSNRILPDGRRGVFHPDNFTFGQPVYLSKLYAVAQSAAGADSVQITKFQRQGNAASDATASGVLEIGRLEIARCDNDPNFPERGVFRLTLRGGK